MKHYPTLYWKGVRRLQCGWMLLVIGIIPLVAGLVLGRTITPVHDIAAAPDEIETLRNYTIEWHLRSFDETLWRAVSGIAAMEEFLPQKVARFQVEIKPAEDTYLPVVLAFDRIDLEHLKVGEITPEVFIREYVKFN